MSDDHDRHAAHRETVREFSRAGGPLDKDGPHSTLNNPAWFIDGKVDQPTARRRALWRRLRDEARPEAPGARQDGKAIVLAGPPGAGKGHVQSNVLGLDKDAWLVVDADKFKDKLLREAMNDGSYETFLKPDAVREREAAGEPFFPLELAALVHEESSHLARLLRDEALREGTNVVIDSVLSNPRAAVALGNQLSADGYEVEVVDVEVPYELSQARIAQRWRESYEGAVVTGEGLGGRWVPSVYAREVFNGPGGRARSQESAAALARACAAVLRYRRFWTRAAESPMRVETDMGRFQRGGELVDYSLIATRARSVASSPTVSRRGSHPRAPGTPELARD
ncbi:zeta toxin family protein [Cellulosimicrobium cellulans]|uniref:zeta toxin family protein n=1 Tax=Cellulosimicrobium cellulans TaxID=1710 RepID=UPI00196265AD|nr:zeta toxin family protein [Cellulosimicrobium cellulans]MBN0042257.1 zeta toxin family protein [Cellulosimicrobium cellulans]